MNLLVITSSYPRNDGDLAGHFVRSWCDALVNCGHRVDVLAWRGPGIEKETVATAAERSPTVRFVPYGPRRWESLFYGAGAPENLRSRPMRALWGMPAVAAMMIAALRACRGCRYDLVVGHWLVPGGLLARAVGRLIGIDSAVVGHSGGVHLLEGLSPAVGQKLMKMVLAGPTTVPTAALREKLGQMGEAVTVAPMGYEPVAEGGKKRQCGDGLRLGFLGRLVPIKGLPVVMRAVRELRASGLNVELEVVGDGPCRELWEAEAGDGVRFAGARFGMEKGERLACWDALVVPSRVEAGGRHEGLPVSLLEASSVGAVPLVSGVPGVERWLARPKMQVVAEGDVRAWCEAIEEMSRLSGPQWMQVREETRAVVAELAWPRYAAWWQEWLLG